MASSTATSPQKPKRLARPDLLDQQNQENRAFVIQMARERFQAAEPVVEYVDTEERETEEEVLSTDGDEAPNNTEESEEETDNADENGDQDGQTDAEKDREKEGDKEDDKEPDNDDAFASGTVAECVTAPA